MSIWVKVCGIRDEETAAVCEEVGVDAVGFVFADSPRRISAVRAGRIASGMAAAMAKVAVFRRPSIAAVDRVRVFFPFDLIQADHTALAGVTGIGTLPVFREGDGVEESVASFCTKRPGVGFLYEGGRSGVGEKVDWRRAGRVARLGPMVLAGGLTPGNVGEAVRRVRPHGVDVSSGVESRRGRKDPGLIAAFVEAVRAAEAEVAP
ncbi:MAG: phosphoribosylanthranilate isomerase [Acidimicrobiia bacterium]